MCGIAGIVRSGNGFLQMAEATALVGAMTDSIAHRGPDASGLWSDPIGRCVLGHRRLSIIDTSPAGRQPMATGDQRWWITFNGELYNFQEVRPAIEAAGVRLRGRTDTEVLIESVALWGTEAFKRFDGMFAFGAFDTQSGDLVLARDPFGEKPIYYIELPGGDFAFASELQALERLPGFDGTVDIDTIAEVLSFQYIGAPRSIYSGVKKLPPAHWLRRDAQGKITTGRYYQFNPGLSGFDDRLMSDLADELEEILTRSIRRRLIADVPLGAFLSGGVDSSTVCALVRRKLNLPLMTFSTGFSGAPESEHLTARAFAKHLGTDHHEEILTPDAADFLLHIGERLDEPNGDSSCLPTYLLSRFARRHVTVAVSGDGGDEMFGGYGRYLATHDEMGRHQKGELPDWTPGAVYFGNRILITQEKHLAELLGFVPDGFATRMARLRDEVDGAQDRLLCELRRTDVDNYMPGAVLSKVDRMSMQHSLEVRTPFLNTELARFAERLPDAVLIRNGRGKQILREVAYRYLPRELIDLPKQGFGLPMSDWARTSLLDVAGKLIESDDGRLRSMLGDGIARFMRRQRTPGQFSAYQVWCVAMLESWLRHHPVKLPQLEDRQRNKRSYHGLAATMVAENTFALVAPLAAGASEETIEDQFEILAALLPSEACATVPRTEPRTITFPEWGETTDLDQTELARFKGATLLCLDPQTARKLDLREFGKLQELGIARLSFPNPYRFKDYETIEFRHQGVGARVKSLAWLISEAVGVISNRRLARWLRPYPFDCTGDIAISAPMKRIEEDQQRDLSTEYMLFEGGRQLPPVQVAHEDIRTKGNGRYSVWHRQLYFSPSAPSRLYKWPYWVVPLNEKTRPLLPFVPHSIASRRGPRETILQVEELLKQRAPAVEPLRPGDPIVVCTHGLSAGGAERQWVYLAQALSDAGYDVTMVIYHPLTGVNAHYLPMLEKSGVKVTTACAIPPIDLFEGCAVLPGAAALLSSNAVPERVRLMRLAVTFFRLRPKAVFAQLDQPNVLAAFAAVLAGVPRVVMSFRNYNPTKFPYIDQPWYQGAYRLLSISGRVLFSGNHRAANDDYADWIGIPRERIAHIPNAIDAESFPVPTYEQVARVRAELGIDDRSPILLGVFRLEKEKGALTFVEVCGRVARLMPQVRAFMVGIGPLKGEIEERIAHLEISRHLTLLGRRSDVNVLLKLATVFLLASEIEGMPNVLMEAQLMGTPIVATRAGGTSETAIDGETAILCDVGDVEGLSAACVSLLSSPSRAQRMGAAGRRHALTAFPKDAMARRYIDLAGGAQTNRDSDQGQDAMPDYAPANAG